MRASLWRAACAALPSLLVGCQLELSEPVAEAPAADVELASSREALNAAEASLARWSSVVDLPIVPVSAANLPDGKILLWSAENRFSFGDDLGRTYTVTFDPATDTSTERLVNETGHDMFCPGTANLPDGRILVNGGLSAGTTSIFDPVSGSWADGGDMQIARAYQGTTPLHDGSVLTLGGSWAGGNGNKHGELWTDGAWRRLPGVLIDPFLSVDASRDFGGDSHLWLLPAGNGRVFHAGPGINMNWIDTAGSGRVLPLGRRSDDEFSINGGAFMYDYGRILKVGGGPGYDSVNSNANSYVIELGAGVEVRKIQSMAYRRAFHNGVVLPNGQVVVIGGATFAVGFSDNNAVLAPELFDPITETFAVLPPMNVPRNYHSVALLLPDGRVLSAGGGLCGNNCAANHADLQILSPPYLFDDDGTPATRPVILSAPTAAAHGTSMSVATDGPVTTFALVRLSSTTHALNNDQRRLPLTFTEMAPSSYAVDVPTNPGWAVPGLYMLFAMNADGTPSVARTVRIGSPTLLRVRPLDDQATTSGAEISLAVQAQKPGAGMLSFGATGLPPGLAIDPVSGVIDGVVGSAGKYLVEVSISDGLQTVSSEFAWTVSEPGTTRYVLVEALGEVAGNPWTSIAELDLLDDDGQLLSRGAWTVTADSVELAGQNGAARNAIDGDPATMWHTQWQAASPPPPHWLRIDLGGSFRVAGLRYLPRQDASSNGTIAQYRVFASGDGVSWGAPVATGDLRQLGAVNDEKTVYFTNVALGKPATQSSDYEGAVAARAVDGNRDSVYANGSVTHTNADANAFWEVDLGGAYQLFGVRLWGRSDCCGDRLSNFYVFASELPMAGRTLEELLADPNVAVQQVAGTSPPVQPVTLSARARYVRVQLGATNFLHLGEVEVYGRLATNRAPVVVRPTPANLVIDAPASLSLEASDPDGDPLSFAATGLPPGLSLNAVTGVISGTPTALGSYGVDVTVTDGRGGATSMRFTWFVGLTPPTVQPVAAPVTSSGAAASYTVAASGSGALTYQWSFGDGTGDSGFSSSPSATHSFTAPGVYVVTVTVRNSDGSSTARQFLQAVAGPSTPGRAVSSSQLAFEPRPGQSPRLWVVNPDNDSVSVFDAVSRTRVAQIDVGSAPRALSIAPDGRVWVTNKGASTVHVISATTLAVVQTINLPRAAQPYGIVHGADGAAFVTLGATGRLLKLSATGATLASLDVGPNPRGLALDAAGNQLLVSCFVTPFQPGENTGLVESAVDGQLVGGEVVVVNPGSMTVRRTIVLRHSEAFDTTISGRGVPNYLGAPAISPDGLSAWVPSKQDNVKRGTLRDLRNLDFQNTVRAISSRIDLDTQAEDHPARIDHDNSSVASAALHHPSGAYMFVALETSRHVAVVDAYGERELFRVDAGRAPQALELSSDGRTLFVHNFMDRSIGVYDLTRLLDFGETVLPLVATLGSVSTERLGASVLRGKQLFYDARDPRLSRDGYMSCATCHHDGAADGRTWDITGMGEGLRNTANLRGHGGAPGRLHWSSNFDEVQDFEGQIRGLNQGTGLMSDAAFNAGSRSQPLGDAKAGQSADLDALAAYVNSLASADPSPYRQANGALTAEGVAGRAVFARECVSCHGGASFSDSGTLALRNVGTITAASGQRLGAALTGLDTPALRDAWATAPYLHDGSAATIELAVQAHTNLSLSAGELASVAAFTRQIGSEEPTVAPPLAAPGLSGQYFANITLSGTPALTRAEAVSFNWGTGAPGTGVAADNFSVRWTGQIVAPVSGSYRVRTETDDGVRVWVGGTQVINNWTDHGPTLDTSAPIAMIAGQRYDVRMEYYERGGGAVARLSWLLPGTATYVVVPVEQLSQPGAGLTAHYFANDALSGAPGLTRIEGVNFNWGNGGPGAGLPADNFSARWSGSLEAPSAGTYRLQTVSDDGVRLYVNGVLLIDNWTPHGPTVDVTPPLSLAAGQRYDIVVEYQELTVTGTMQLMWLPPGATTATVIPTTQLHPGGAGLRGSYFANANLTGAAVLTRTENVDFGWNQAAPGPGVPADDFSVRWTGQVGTKVSGSYRFRTVSDDGVRVFVNGTQVINNWTPHGDTTDTSAVVNLAAGQRYEFRVEHQDTGGGATMRLSWLTPGATAYVTIPASQLHAN
jgi:YVTN family beta-propeller protein